MKNIETNTTIREQETTKQSHSAAKSTRIVSLDALRGFTMFWIIGAGAFFRTLPQVIDLPLFRWLSTQFIHAPWNGFRFYDLIFPLFMFISGVAIPFSIGRQSEKGACKREIIFKAAKRSLILVVFGVIYNNKFSFDFAQMRYASVLGQIGVAYFFAVLIYTLNDVKRQVFWIIGILLGFWAAMTLIPVPGVGAGVLTPEGNFSGYIDRLLLPGTLYRGTYDPQGLLLMISAIAVTAIGSLGGSFLKNSKFSDMRKIVMMTLAGIGLVLISLIWNVWYPINKEIWSSSYNVLTAGLSLVLFAAFYYLIDVRHFKKWAFPLIVMGLNSITIYLAHRMINFQYTSDFILAGILSISGPYGSLVSIAGAVVIQFAFLYILYRKKIFLKI